jgi:hypothetical protein
VKSRSPSNSAPAQNARGIYKRTSAFRYNGQHLSVGITRIISDTYGRHDSTHTQGGSHGRMWRGNEHDVACWKSSFGNGKSDGLVVSLHSEPGRDNTGRLFCKRIAVLIDNERQVHQTLSSGGNERSGKVAETVRNR